MTWRPASAGLIGRIPVRNIWLLMLYASRLYREIPTNRRVAVEDNPDEIPNLVAEILALAVERRLRRNLSADFHRRQADLNRVRGRINLLRTERRHLLEKGKIACSFEELTTNTQLNQFVKAALQELPKTLKDRDLARRCRIAATAMERAGVSNGLASIRWLGSALERSAAGRTSSEDLRMLAAARLAFSLDLPTEDPGSSRLPTPDRDNLWARRLFEAAIGGFYDTLLSPLGWLVKTGSWIDWQTEDTTPGMAAILPSMQTDIVLERPADCGQGSRTRTVIDTKFNHILGEGQYGNHRIRSGYLYQIYAYLRSQETDSDPLSLNASGLLLHPSVDGEIDETATIQGHLIRFATVDLTAGSQVIRSRLLTLAQTGQAAVKL
ncbi:MAG: 5-methylcytosine-specific restriction endonuclease system specificity protein McrC [Chloroflexi bacterium]|nr:5-methylcytosine-specific restriction endonuclease system specificity protein McrC [Chloroflexota bacterium]